MIYAGRYANLTVTATKRIHGDDTNTFGGDTIIGDGPSDVADPSCETTTAAP